MASVLLVDDEPFNHDDLPLWFLGGSYSQAESTQGGAPELAQLQLDVVKKHVLKPAREQVGKFVNLLAKEVGGHVKKVRAR
jgi:hypothetical protein